MPQAPPCVHDASGGRRRERYARFCEIERHYRGLQAGATRDQRQAYQLTALGAWAASIPAHVFRCFAALRLSRHRLLIDLGSGDGVVACVAGLFTRAVGIEVDPTLCARAQGAVEALNLEDRVSIVCADYCQQPIRRADCLYLYPDKPLGPLEELLGGWGGLLIVCGPHFPPTRWVALQEWVMGRDRFVVYRQRPVQQHFP
jgi:hypothetical protein